jgi:AAA family ATP:ADP antiporter
MGEGASVIVLALNVFLLLTSYYIVKTVREAWILTDGGAEVKSYAAAGQAILLLFLVPAYSRLASRLARLRLITVVTLFFVACLFVFYLLARLQLPLGIPFFLWVGIFNVMIIAQFWSFANDLYTPEEGKRLFAIIGFGAASGAVIGSFIAGRLIAPLGVPQLLLAAAIVLLFSLGLTYAASSLERQRRAAPRESATPEQDRPDAAAPDIDQEGEPLAGDNPFALLWRNRYLLAIALLMLLVNWVNTTGEYLLGRVVTGAASEAVAAGTAGGLSESEYIGKFYADFFSVVNVLAMVMQLFLVSRLIKYLGIRICLMLLPAIALGGYLLLASMPLLAVIRWVKTAENATDYSLQNTVRNVLFLPTNRTEKYKAKQAIDTFFWRAGDVLSALLVYVGTQQLALTTRGFAMVNVVLVVMWLAVAAVIGRQFSVLQNRRV